MAEKLLVCVSAEQVTTAQWRRRGIADCRLFRNDAGGLAAFSEHLTAMEGIPAYLMADAVEEDYRFETLPHAFGSDRAEMVRRKLRQHYRNSAYANAWLLGRDAGRRRDDRYMFSALTNAELLNTWLQALAGHARPVAGVFLLPMTATALAETLQLRAPNLLLISQHSSGLRLTFLRERQFRLSRLTSGESNKSGGSVRLITEEIANTRIYLHALRAARLDEPLTVVLLDHNDRLAEVARNIAEESPGLQCRHLGRQALSERLNIAPALLDMTAHVMFLQLLGRRTPAANLAPVSITTEFRQYQARRGIYAAAGIIALIGAAWTTANTWRIVDTHAMHARTAQETNRLQLLYRNVTREFPHAPASAENLRKTVEIARKLEREAGSPERVMHVVSRGLEASPGIALEELTWKHGLHDLRGGSTISGPAAPTMTSSPPGQSALVSGQVKPFHGNYRAAIETIQSFAKRLGRDPAVAEVRLIKLPLNVDPTLTLSGNTLEDGAHSGAAEFKLLLIVKTGHEPRQSR